jgi:hypothetical protein
MAGTDLTINEQGTVTEFKSLALTNAPRTNHLQPLLASLAAAAQHKESTMSNDFRAQLAAALGIDQAASDETVVASIPAIKEQVGTVLPVDDPFWDTHYPPIGFNCRCGVRSLSESELERYRGRLPYLYPSAQSGDV